LRLLRSHGIDRVVLCIGHFGSNIQKYLADNPEPGMHIQYSLDGPTLLGTAGALRRALPLLGDRFFVVYGDSYLPCDYQAVGSAHQRSGREALMTVFRNDGMWEQSNVEYANGKILAYDKKIRNARMNHVDYGLGVFSLAAFQRVPPETVFDLASLYQMLLADSQLAAFEVAERFYEIGSIEGLADLSERLS
ncbi:MAG: nucleotidyl transferase, partial [Acidobacteriota bacterium]|nr:nucleotidyl transferase [Acidobacteriota bacterium]